MEPTGPDGGQIAQKPTRLGPLGGPAGGDSAATEQRQSRDRHLDEAQAEAQVSRVDGMGKREKSYTWLVRQSEAETPQISENEKVVGGD